MRVKESKDFKKLIVVKNPGSSFDKALKELASIRDGYVSLNENLNPFADYENVIKLMKKKKAVLSVSNYKENMVFMRCFNDQPLEILNFKVLKAMSSSDFDTIPAELFVKYFVLVQNISNPKIENFFIDLLSQKTLKINLDAVKYAWVINETNGVFTIKFVRILNDNSVQDIGPYFELKLENEFFCGDELYEKAFETIKPVKQKNVSKNVFKDKVGKLHIDKQDLKEVNLKKSRAYRRQDRDE